MQLFQRNGTRCQPIEQWLAPLEQDIHQLIGANLDTLLGVRLIGHEIETQYGRMDTLGIDALGGPVIIEFKRARTDHIINQALSYQIWLDNNRERFNALMGYEMAESVDWSALRIICIASAFSPYDKQSISLFKANIDLVEYALYGKDLLSLNPVAFHRLPNYAKQHRAKINPSRSSFEQLLVQASTETQERLRRLIESLQNEHSDLSAKPHTDALELSQGDIVARIRLQGSSILRLKADLLMTPDELRDELDPCWWPGLDTYRRKADSFEMSLFDEQSCDAFTAIIAASLRLKQRSEPSY